MAGNNAGELRQGPIERWSGKLLRYIMAYLFLIGLMGVLLTIAHQTFENLIWIPVFTVPYLVIRHRDPDSTTVPLSGYAKGLLS